MDRTRVWPDLEDAALLHHDDALIVVDKPVGVPSQAADPSLPDDLVSRIRSYLARRGEDTYLGVHQRLDRDTSGVMIFTRRRELNAHVAAQFEGRKIDKTYLACVERWKRPGGGIVALRDTLAEAEGGKMRVVLPEREIPRWRGHRDGAKGAVTLVRVGRRENGRVLLELTLETGRTHQARVQLANAGAPIAGDALYGGALAPRLLLHAHKISFIHPVTNARVTFTAPVPPDLDVWLARGDLGATIYDDPQALDRAIRRAVERRFALGRSAGSPARVTTAFRLMNEGGDGVPGLAVDLYDAHLVAQFYDDDTTIWGEASRRERVLDRLHALGADGIYVKMRPKQSNTLVDTRRDDLAPKLPVRGTAADEEIAILEEAIPYRARLGDGLSTGIFLDQRANRRKVKALAGGRSVANLFAYTCGFSVAAAMGGARLTVSVDVSPLVLERGRALMESMGLLDTGEHTFVADDVFRWLAKSARKNETYDLVILDPPSYSTTRARRFVASSDYAELAAASFGVVAPGGQLLACTNHRGIHHGKFRKALFEGAERSGRVVRQIKDLPCPSDFPPPIGGEPHLKSALVTLEP